MGVALAASTFAFAQEAPFTVTENYVRMLTADNAGAAGAALGGDIRSGCAVNGAFYMLNKATGEIWKVDDKGQEVVRTLDVNVDGNVLQLALGADDAGNLLAFRVKGDFWAGPALKFIVIPADASKPVAEYDIPAIAGFDNVRTDCIGRISGDMLSEDGAIYYMTSASPAGATASAIGAYLISASGVVPAADPVFPSSALPVINTGGLNTAVPMYNSFEEQMTADPIYDGCYFMPWSDAPYGFADEEAYKIARPEGLIYSAVPGGDVINRGEEGVYIVGNYTTTKDKRDGNFCIYKQEGAELVWKSDFSALTTAYGAFLNGGCLTVRQTDENTYDIYSFTGGNKAGAIIASYTVKFTVPVPPITEITLKEQYTRMLTADNAGAVGAALGGDIRSGCAVNGAFYMLNKATGEIWKVDDKGQEVVRTLDVNVDGNVLQLALGADDAGNLLAFRVKGDFWAGPALKFIVIPADASKPVAEYDIPAIAGFDNVRTDCIGRISGDMLSEDGAIYYMTSASPAGATASAIGAYLISASGVVPAADPVFPSSALPVINTGGLNTAVPMYNSFEEQMTADPIYDGCYFMPWSDAPYGFADEEAYKIARPEGLIYSAVPGGDVINRGEEGVYIVGNYTTTKDKRDGNFCIYKQEGAELVWKSDFSALTTAYGAFLNGGCLTVRKIDENTYGIYSLTGGNKAGAIISYYTIEFPAAPAPQYPEQLYLIGGANDFTEPIEANAEALKAWTLTQTEPGIYEGTFNIPVTKSNFRFYSALTGWDGGDSYGVSELDGNNDAAMTENFSAPFIPGKGNYNFPFWYGGEMAMKVDFTSGTLYITPAAFEAPELYVRGENINAWGEGVKMELNAADGKYVYTVTLPELNGEFKIATADFSYSVGTAEASAVVPVDKQTAVKINGNNMKAENLSNITVTLELNPNPAEDSYITLTAAAAPAARAAMAYDVKLTANEGKYAIDYKVSAPAKSARLILTNAADASKTVTVDMPAPEVGDNHFDFEPAADMESGQYNYAIEIVSEIEGEEPVKVVYNVLDGQGAQVAGRGGVVSITDPEYASYGYTLVAGSHSMGVDVYDPTGAKVGNYWGNSVLNTDNSSPLRGDQRFGKAVFAAWSDGNSGAWYVDPLNPTEEPKQIFPGERDKAGVITYNGVQTGSSTPAIAFVGKGENTRAWTFDEDIYGNSLTWYAIGNAEEITTAGTVPMQEDKNWSKSALANTAVCIEPASNGFFAAQTRADGMDMSTPAFIYCDVDGMPVVKCADLMIDAEYTLPSCAGIVALNKEENVLAVGSYEGIHFFSVEWTDGVPALTHLYDVTGLLKGTFGQAKFDAAGNLYVYNDLQDKVNNVRGTQAYMAVIALPGENVATTAGKAADIITIQSGVEDVIYGAEDADAVYYNLNGVRVAAEDLVPGVYVKVVGNTATKVVVK